MWKYTHSMTKNVSYAHVQRKKISFFAPSNQKILFLTSQRWWNDVTLIRSLCWCVLTEWNSLFFKNYDVSRVDMLRMLKEWMNEWTHIKETHSVQHVSLTRNLNHPIVLHLKNSGIWSRRNSDNMIKKIAWNTNFSIFLKLANLLHVINKCANRGQLFQRTRNFALIRLPHHRIDRRNSSSVNFEIRRNRDPLKHWKELHAWRNDTEKPKHALRTHELSLHHSRPFLPFVIDPTFSLMFPNRSASAGR